MILTKEWIIIIIAFQTYHTFSPIYVNIDRWKCMVGLKGKIYYGVLFNISISYCFVFDCNKIVLAIYAVLILYYVYIMVIYDCMYVKNIMH